MKALVIASVLFFSLRAMSSVEGENLKGECPYSTQTSIRSSKLIEPVETESIKDIKSVKTISM